VWRFLYSGIGLKDVEAFMLLILICRFILLVIRYDFVVAFKIVAVNGGAAYLWWHHLIDITIRYHEVLMQVSFTREFTDQSLTLQKGSELEAGLQASWWNPIKTILIALKKGWTYKDYKIDPISMLFAKYRDGWYGKQTLNRIYYFFYRRLFPFLFYIVKTWRIQFGNTIFYSLCTRVQKKYCPYFIRWHWTMLFTYEFLEPGFQNFYIRGMLYIVNVLDPRITSSLKTIESNKANLTGWGENAILTRVIAETRVEKEWLYLSLIAMALAHMAIIIYPMLHALVGQYYYVPFITENTDVHCGPYNKTLYSGGNQPWRNAIYDLDNRKKEPKKKFNLIKFLRRFLKFIKKKFKS